MVEGRLPTVPEYYKEFIDRSVDLTMTPKQCCPFHQEDTPSFSYNKSTGRWSCFGKCHAHGDVIEMHKRYFHYSSRDEAERNLCSRCKVPIKPKIQMKEDELFISDDKVQDNAVYAEACRLANTPERWLELDYEMSKYPFERDNILVLINKWKGKKLFG